MIDMKLIEPQIPNYYPGILFTRETIAGAVAREIRAQGCEGDLGLEHTNYFYNASAYKAAWDRKGSDASKHIAAAFYDFQIMRDLTLIANARKVERERWVTAYEDAKFVFAFHSEGSGKFSALARMWLDYHGDIK